MTNGGLWDTAGRQHVVTEQGAVWVQVYKLTDADIESIARRVVELLKDSDAVARP